MVTPEQYNKLREMEELAKKEIANLPKKKTKVKKILDGYYFDGKDSWTIFKTPTGMTIMTKDKEKKNVH
tara:strand:+ start:388 stop:594 length:207 start_codon:yes stop_codon:yes gene_type:complete